MKNILCYILACTAVSWLLAACQKKLVEQPLSVLTPDFLKTAQGLQAGLDAAYAGTRMIWGPQDYFNMTVVGTDEFISGNDGDNSMVKYASSYNTSNGNVGNVWKYCYTYINACNGVVDFAPAATGIDTASKKRVTGEAKFLRAVYYFTLVQFWGDVTLNKNFQSTPTTAAVRAPMADVYNFIIQDLTDAIASLPASPQSGNVLPGKATQAAAMHLLAKVYLTRGSSAAKQPTDFKNAYTIAGNLINNFGPANGVKLVQDFKQVYAEGNETNSEVLWTVQHTANLAYNGSSSQNNSGPDNLYCHLFVPQYETRPGMQRDVFYGRPYIRCVPTRWLTDTVFKERVNDTRYSKTFQTVWYANATAAGSYPVWSNPLPPGAPAGAQPGKPRFAQGDTAIYMPGVDVSDAKIAASPYLLIPPRKYDITLSPTVTKYFDTKRSDMNAPSIRPVIVMRLGETYLIAAEALLLDGRTADAVAYINAIRERAAYPTGNPAAMDITASSITLDFILDERSRELCGEVTRWLDLIRTGQLIKRVQLHNTDGQKNIQPRHILRPIPQAQIDAVTTGTPYPQNPGW